MPTIFQPVSSSHRHIPENHMHEIGHQRSTPQRSRRFIREYLYKTHEQLCPPVSSLNSHIVAPMQSHHFFFYSFVARLEILCIHALEAYSGRCSLLRRFNGYIALSALFSLLLKHIYHTFMVERFMVLTAIPPSLTEIMVVPSLSTIFFALLVHTFSRP